MTKILQWWVGRSLPKNHIFGGGVKKIFLAFFVHPIKRRIAKYYVSFLQKYFGLVVVGITGSAGKTTTKEMIAEVLSDSANTVWSEANIDPVFNIPTTILRCTPWTKYLVLEMGVEYLGEMDFYMWLVKPKIGVITNIYPAHTLYFGDLEGVAREKSNLVKALGKNGYAVLNKNNKFTKQIARNLKSKIVYFGANGNSIEQNKDAVKKIAEILKIDSQKTSEILENFKFKDGRFERIHNEGIFIYNDSYNSNPEALLATLKIFNSETKDVKNKIGVFGDMLELGSIEISEHKRVGLQIAKSNFNTVITVGKLSYYIAEVVKSKSPKTKVYSLDEYKQTVNILKKNLKKNTAILIKGSHSTNLYKLSDMLYPNAN